MAETRALRGEKCGRGEEERRASHWREKEKGRRDRVGVCVC